MKIKGWQQFGGLFYSSNLPNESIPIPQEEPAEVTTETQGFSHPEENTWSLWGSLVAGIMLIKNSIQSFGLWVAKSVKNMFYQQPSPESEIVRENAEVPEPSNIPITTEQRTTIGTQATQDSAEAEDLDQQEASKIQENIAPSSEEGNNSEELPLFERLQPTNTTRDYGIDFPFDDEDFATKKIRERERILGLMEQYHNNIESEDFYCAVLYSGFLGRKNTKFESTDTDVRAEEVTAETQKMQELIKNPQKLLKIKQVLMHPDKNNEDIANATEISKVLNAMTVWAGKPLAGKRLKAQQQAEFVVQVFNLEQGINAEKEGVKELAQGVEQLAQGVEQLAQGVKELAQESKKNLKKAKKDLKEAKEFSLKVDNFEKECREYRHKQEENWKTLEKKLCNEVRENLHETVAQFIETRKEKLVEYRKSLINALKKNQESIEFENLFILMSIEITAQKLDFSHNYQLDFSSDYFDSSIICSFNPFLNRLLDLNPYILVMTFHPDNVDDMAKITQRLTERQKYQEVKQLLKNSPESETLDWANQHITKEQECFDKQRENFVVSFSNAETSLAIRVRSCISIIEDFFDRKIKAINCLLNKREKNKNLATADPKMSVGELKELDEKLEKFKNSKKFSESTNSNQTGNFPAGTKKTSSGTDLSNLSTMGDQLPRLSNEETRSSVEALKDVPFYTSETQRLTTFSTLPSSGNLSPDNNFEKNLSQTVSF